MTQPPLEYMELAHLDIVCSPARYEVNSNGNDDAFDSRIVVSAQAGEITYVIGTRWRDCDATRAAFDECTMTTENVVTLWRVVSGIAAAFFAGREETITA